MTALSALTLYHYGNSVCSEKVRLALNEKSLPWLGVHVDITKGEQFSPQYLKLNPKGVVPTLVHSGRAIVESTLIVEYLDDAFPEPGLKPVDPYERAAARQFSKLCDEGLHQGVAMLTGAAVFLERLRAQPRQSAAEFLARIRDLERRDRQTALYELGMDAPHFYRGIAAFENAFQKLEHTLADGRPWLCGGQYSIAEINLAPYMARLEYLGLLDVWMVQRPRVARWYERIRQRPSFAVEVVELLNADELQQMRTGGARIKERVSDMRSRYLATDAGAA